MNWVGKPAPALELRIVDMNGNDVPPGEAEKWSSGDPAS